MRIRYELPLALGAAASAAIVPSPPKTPVRPVIETIHGDKITDNYYWLEHANSPETSAWVHEQIRCTPSFLDPLSG